MKKISELNNKWWYRFLKVIFLFLFLTIISGINYALLENGAKKIDNSKTIIYCVANGKSISAKKANIDFGNYNFGEGFDYEKFYEGYNEYIIRDIFKNCYGYDKYEDIFAIQRNYEIQGLKDSPREYDEDYLREQINHIKNGYKTDSEKSSYLDYSIHLFEIEPIYSYRAFASHLVIYNISVLLFFEIIKRVFYYIALGKIKPSK